MSTTERARRELLALLTSGRKLAGYQLRERLADKGVYISESACTARVRDLRKPNFGGHEVRKELSRDLGTFVYFIPGQSELFEAA